LCGLRSKEIELPWIEASDLEKGLHRGDNSLRAPETDSSCHALQSGYQVSPSKGLAKEWIPFRNQDLGYHFAWYENDGDRRPAVMDQPCERYSVHAWRHVDVAVDNADIGTTFEVLDRLLGVRRPKG
jgi:hypothetical protein